MSCSFDRVPAVLVSIVVQYVGTDISWHKSSNLVEVLMVGQDIFPGKHSPMQFTMDNKDKRSIGTLCHNLDAAMQFITDDKEKVDWYALWVNPSVPT